MTTLLKTVNLCKSYGALRVTDGVSLDIQTGELHAIIGPNGAGKTTLINQLSGELAALPCSNSRSLLFFAAAKKSVMTNIFFAPVCFNARSMSARWV